MLEDLVVNGKDELGEDIVSWKNFLDEMENLNKKHPEHKPTI